MRRKYAQAKLGLRLRAAHLGLELEERALRALKEGTTRCCLPWISNAASFSSNTMLWVVLLPGEWGLPCSLAQRGVLGQDKRSRLARVQHLCTGSSLRGSDIVLLCRRRICG